MEEIVRYCSRAPFQDLEEVAARVAVLVRVLARGRQTVALADQVRDHLISHPNRKAHLLAYRIAKRLSFDPTFDSLSWFKAMLGGSNDDQSEAEQSDNGKTDVNKSIDVKSKADESDGDQNDKDKSRIDKTDINENDEDEIEVAASTDNQSDIDRIGVHNANVINIDPRFGGFIFEHLFDRVWGHPYGPVATFSGVASWLPRDVTACQMDSPVCQLAARFLVIYAGLAWPVLLARAFGTASESFPLSQAMADDRAADSGLTNKLVGVLLDLKALSYLFESDLINEYKDRLGPLIDQPQDVVAPILIALFCHLTLDEQKETTTYNVAKVREDLFDALVRSMDGERQTELLESLSVYCDSARRSLDKPVISREERHFVRTFVNNGRLLRRELQMRRRPRRFVKEEGMGAARERARSTGARP